MSRLRNTILTLFLLSFLGLSWAYSGSRSILRAINVQNDDLHDHGVELNVTNFDSVLKETPATYAVVEFFAHWSAFIHFHFQLKVFFFHCSFSTLVY